MLSQEILLIEDDPDFRELLARTLKTEGYKVVEAKSVHSAIKFLKSQKFELVISDANLGDGNGIDIIPKIKSLQASVEVIILTSYGRVKDGVQAIKNGAYDYLEKGSDHPRLIPLVEKALDKVRLNEKIASLEKLVDANYGFDMVIGDSPAILQAKDLAMQVAITDATVLLLGETGTGKEVFSRAIHQSSTRANRNFVAVNCSAFSKDLLDSELFGHKAGAFTGATHDKKGLFEEAHMGTLFLDEIGEMPIDLQAKLLRVLETNTFMRVGESKTTQVDVRIIAATNRQLAKVNSANFRADLYYRLSVFQIELPPLRERKEDILGLINFFMKKFSNAMQKPVPTVEPEFYQRMTAYDWKGNIRELRNVIERSIILSKGNLTSDSLPYEIRSSQKHTATNEISRYDLNSVERNHIRQVLDIANGNKSKAASMLNIGLSTLYRKLKEYDLNQQED